MKAHMTHNHAQAVALGDLYDELLAIAVRPSSDPGYDKKRLADLVDKYGMANVAWIHGVVLNDLAEDP